MQNVFETGFLFAGFWAPPMSGWRLVVAEMVMAEITQITTDGKK